MILANYGWAVADAPTYGSDVAPILAAHCVQCHRPRQIAARVELLSYDQARSRAADIKRQVRDREMPPWPADPQRSVAFRNDARLDQRDIDTLVAWVDAGAPRGEVSPPAMVANDGWLHPDGRKPDVVIALPPVNIPASGKMPYIPLHVNVPGTGDKWIAAMQVKPGNSEIMHHMGITEEERTSGLSPDLIDDFRSTAQRLGIPEDALEGGRPAVRNPVAANELDMLGVYTPGSTFEMYPAGTGKLLKGGANYYINFNAHYTANGVAQIDRSQFALWYLERPPRHQLFRTPIAVASLIANGRQLLTDDPGTKAEGTDVAIPPIPKNAENYELIGMTAFSFPVTIYQMQPHAHMRAKDFTYVVVYPDGEEKTILSVPRYDFHWQLAYDLQTPLVLPAGSKLIVQAHYDNSVNNPHLRDLGTGDLARNCGPDREAYFQRENQSWDEMFTPLVQYAVTRTQHPMPLVEVVGCAVPRASKRGWSLAMASAARATPQQSTSAAALQQTASQPLGTKRYRLLGVDAFDRQLSSQKRLAVKGVLIVKEGEQSLNVTSMQSISGDCP